MIDSFKAIALSILSPCSIILNIKFQWGEINQVLVVFISALTIIFLTLQIIRLIIYFRDKHNDYKDHEEN